MARPAATIHSLLRDATRELHEDAEQTLAPLLVGDAVTLASVRAALRALYGFHAPLEARLGAAAAAPFPAMDRAARIARDLAALGDGPGDIAGLPRCADLPVVDGAASAAGCLYVIEGAQLGGQVIARELAGRLGIGPANGAGFFAGDGAAAVAARWRLVLRWIEAVGAAPGRAAEMVRSARATFDSLSRWLAQLEAKAP